MCSCICDQSLKVKLQNCQPQIRTNTSIFRFLQTPFFSFISGITEIWISSSSNIQLIMETVVTLVSSSVSVESFKYFSLCSVFMMFSWSNLSRSRSIGLEASQAWNSSVNPMVFPRWLATFWNYFKCRDEMESSIAKTKKNSTCLRNSKICLATQVESVLIEFHKFSILSLEQYGKKTCNGKENILFSFTEIARLQKCSLSCIALWRRHH